MNAHTQINTALLARGSLPMDGYCSCPCCGREGLARDDMTPNDGGLIWRQSMEVHGRPICARQQCADLLYIEATSPPRTPDVPRVACVKCNGRGRSGSEWNYVRQELIRNDCPKCDGEGFLEVVA